MGIRDDNSDGTGQIWAWGKNSYGQVHPRSLKPKLSQAGE